MAFIIIRMTSVRTVTKAGGAQVIALRISIPPPATPGCESPAYQSSSPVDRSITLEEAIGNPAKLSVIVVSDYASGSEKSWGDIRRALLTWADQEETSEEECMLVESTRFEGRIPSDILKVVPNSQNGRLASIPAIYPSQGVTGTKQSGN